MNTNLFFVSLLALPLLSTAQAQKETPPVVAGKDITVVPTESGNVRGYVHNETFTFRTGNLDHKGLPNWPAYTAQNGAAMLFDITCQVENHHDKELIELATGKAL